MEDDDVVIIEEDQELVAIAKSDEKIQRVLAGRSSHDRLVALGSKRISGMHVKDIGNLFANDGSLAIILGLAVNLERLNVSIQDFASDYEGMVESSDSIVRCMKWIQVDVGAACATEEHRFCPSQGSATAGGAGSSRGLPSQTADEPKIENKAAASFHDPYDDVCMHHPRLPVARGPGAEDFASEVSFTPRQQLVRQEKRSVPDYLSWLEDVTITDLKQAAWIHHSQQTPRRDDMPRVARQEEKMEIDAMCVASSAGIDVTSAKQVPPP